MQNMDEDEFDRTYHNMNNPTGIPDADPGAAATLDNDEWETDCSVPPPCARAAVAPGGLVAR